MWNKNKIIVTGPHRIQKEFLDQTGKFFNKFF